MCPSPGSTPENPPTLPTSPSPVTAPAPTRPTRWCSLGAGNWQVTATIELDGETTRATDAFDVLPERIVPAPGDPAPRSTNRLPGEPGVELTAIDSRAADGKVPDPELHAMTVADAIDSGRPTMVVVSTPTYCVSRFCGPITESIDELRESYSELVNFVHLEVWDDYEESVVTKAAAEWIFPNGPDGGGGNEPWVFLIDGDGVVAQRWDNVTNQTQLRAGTRRARATDLSVGHARYSTATVDRLNAMWLTTAGPSRPDRCANSAQTRPATNKPTNCTNWKCVAANRALLPTTPTVGPQRLPKRVTQQPAEEQLLGDRRPHPDDHGEQRPARRTTRTISQLRRRTLHIQRARGQLHQPVERRQGHELKADAGEHTDRHVHPAHVCGEVRSDIARSFDATGPPRRTHEPDPQPDRADQHRSDASIAECADPQRHGHRSRHVGDHVPADHPPRGPTIRHHSERRQRSARAARWRRIARPMPTTIGTTITTNSPSTDHIVEMHTVESAANPANRRIRRDRRSSPVVSPWTDSTPGQAVG